VNSADALVLLFVLACVVGIGGALIGAAFDAAAWRRTSRAIERIGRQTRLGLHERLGGDEITARAAGRRR
jgi:hypothetical protein